MQITDRRRETSRDTERVLCLAYNLHRCWERLPALEGRSKDFRVTCQFNQGSATFTSYSAFTKSCVVQTVGSCSPIYCLRPATWYCAPLTHCELPLFVYFRTLQMLSPLPAPMLKGELWFFKALSYCLLAGVRASLGMHYFQDWARSHWVSQWQRVWCGFCHPQDLECIHTLHLTLYWWTVESQQADFV